MKKINYQTRKYPNQFRTKTRIRQNFIKKKNVKLTKIQMKLKNSKQQEYPIS